MDSGISKRKYPSYTTSQLEEAVAAGRGNDVMIKEIADRKAGVSVGLVVPQIGRLQVPLSQIIAGLAQFAAGIFLITFAVYYVAAKVNQK